MTVRACALHGCSLLDDDESCPLGHFVTSWLIVQDGIVIAEADEDRVRWLRSGKLDDELVPDPDLTGRRPYTIFVPETRMHPHKRDAERRKLERVRAKREGREAASWARIDSGPQFAEVDASFMRGSRFKAQRMRSEEAEG